MAEKRKSANRKRLLSRREFLVGGGAVIAAGALGACAPKTIIETITPTTSTGKPETLTGITVEPVKPDKLAPGSKQQFKAIGSYFGGTTKDISSQVKWQSSDNSVAVINANGEATGVAKVSLTDPIGPSGLSLTANAGIIATLFGINSQPVTLTVVKEPLKALPTSDAFMKGFNFTDWGPFSLTSSGALYAPSQADRSLRDLAATGTDWIALLVNITQETVSSTEVTRHQYSTASDPALRHMIELAHNLGMRVALNPNLVFSRDSAHNHTQIGTTFFTSEEQWQAWFVSYRQAILYYAGLAQEADVDMYFIGNELGSTTQRENDWRRIAQEVRQIYRGSIIYEALHSTGVGTSHQSPPFSEEQRIKWWDAVDYIGVLGYYPLTNKNNPTVEELKSAWVEKGWLALLENLSKNYKKPIIISEIGYLSADGTNTDPVYFEKFAQALADPQEQADCYQAALEVLWGKPWLRGIFWWRWVVNPIRDPGATLNPLTSSSIQGKPAEEVVKKFYLSPGLVEPTPAKCRVTFVEIAPIVASPGEAITVTVNVSNIGGMKGTYSLALKINSTVQETEDIAIEPYSAQTAVYYIVKDVPGLYIFEIEGLTEIVRVKEAGGFPRLANFQGGQYAFYWNPQQKTNEEMASLIKSVARWDIVIANWDVISYGKQYFQQIRKLNPHIIILAYVEAGTGGLWRWKLTNDLQVRALPSWMSSSRADYERYIIRYFGFTPKDSNENLFLHYGGGRTPSNRVILWTNLSTGEEWPGMNPNSDWPNYLANFVKDKVMSSGVFDGVFYDNVWEGSKRFAYISNVDINNDDVAESPAAVQQLWTQGLTKLLKITRDLLGQEAIIFGNPGSEWFANSSYFDYANGHFQENALGKSAYSSHEFSKVWEIYQRNMQKPTPPSRTHIIAADLDNKLLDPAKPTYSTADLQKMRYGLIITLLNDGYYAFGMGDNNYGTLWWFPEYDINLGLAKGKAYQRGDGTWTREFQNGIVVVNPTNNAVTISFGTTYQNASTGSINIRFIVQPQDGGIFVFAR